MARSSTSTSLAAIAAAIVSPPPSAGLTGTRSPGSGGTVTAGTGNGPSQLDMFARLQLAAALLEYDHDVDGKLAEQSAIFQPFRDEITPGPYPQQEEGYPCEEQQQQQYQEQYALVEADPDLAWRTQGNGYDGGNDFGHAQAQDYMASAGGNSELPEGSFSPPPSEQRGALAEEERPGVDDADLASEWGLESVMTKFDQMNPDELRSKHASKKKNPTRARALSRAQTDIYGMTHDASGGDEGAAAPGGSLPADALETLDKGATNPRSEADTDGFGASEILATQSLPDILDSNTLARKRKTQKAKAPAGSIGALRNPKESAGTRQRKESLESELEQAFSEFGGETSGPGGRSRSSSFMMGARPDSRLSFDALGRESAALDMDAQEEITAAYAAEQAARPPSSMGGYVSRFDPKAIAAQREEELSLRLRFPSSPHPRVLIMPAPLADLLVAAKQQDPAEEAAQPAEEPHKPRIEREAGKLYGKSLMDELNERKMRQKAKNRAFQGDSRRAMTDNLLVQRGLLARASSPLGTGGASAGTPVAAVEHSAVDPWVKYTSHRALATLASGGDAKSPKGDVPAASPSPTKSLGNRVTTLLSPDHLVASPSPTAQANKASPTQLISPAGSSTRMQEQQALGHNRHMSTAELQAAYKRSSSMPVISIPAGEDEEDSDDDVPLHARQAQLVANPPAAQSPSKAKAGPSDAAKAMAAAPKPSVFGQDLVMAKELEKLEKILEMEAVERKIQAEKERILAAEREAKDAKKREKAEKKARKKAEKDKRKRTELEAEKREREEREWAEAQIAGIEEEKRKSIAHPLDDKRRTLLMNQGLLPPEDTAEGDNLYVAERAQEEDDDMWNPRSGRNSMLPMSAGEGDAIISPGGRPRSSSLAPSLALSFMPTLSGAGESAIPGSEALGGGTENWFGGASSNSSTSSEDGGDAKERLRVQARPLDDGEDRVDPSDIWDAGARERKKEAEAQAANNAFVLDTARTPELTHVERAESFSGVLEGFGIGAGDDSDDEAGHEGKRKKGKKAANRISTYGNMDEASDKDSGSDSSDEEENLASVAARKSQAFYASPWAGAAGIGSVTANGSTAATKITANGGKITLDPPRLDLPTDFSLGSPTHGADGNKKANGADSDDSDSDVDTPRKRKAAAAEVAALSPPGQQPTSGEMQAGPADEGDAESVDEDDLPLALRQDDELPLGQKHPMAAMTQQIEQQQMANAALVQQMQYQYAMQQQYNYQMQMQQQIAAMQQAAMHGYAGSMLGGYTPSQMGHLMAHNPEALVDMGGAASDIGLAAPPDAKLVSSVDRWRQNVQQ